VPRCRWFRQLIIGVKSWDLTRHKISDRARARARLQVNGGIRQNAKFTPVRTMPKLLFGPSTTFQLKSFIQPICGVMRTSMPPPNCPIAFVSESPERVRDSLKSSGPLAPGAAALQQDVSFRPHQKCRRRPRTGTVQNGCKELDNARSGCLTQNRPRGSRVQYGRS
jgi:hypothetical protein